MPNTFLNPPSRYNYRKVLLKHQMKQYKQCTREGIVTLSGNLISSVLLELFQNKLSFRKQIQMLNTSYLSSLITVQGIARFLSVFLWQKVTITCCIICWTQFRTTTTTCEFQTTVEMGSTVIWVLFCMLDPGHPIQGIDEVTGFMKESITWL